MHFLSDKCQNKLAVAQSIYSAVLRAVVDGSIEVGALRLILTNKERFLKLSEYEKNDNRVIPESGDGAVDKCGVLAAILEWRKEELDATDRVFKQVEQLQGMCTMLERGK